MNRAASSAVAGIEPIPAVLVMVGVLMLGGTLPAPLYLIWQKEMHFSRIVLTLVFAVYFLAAVVALIFFGRLSERMGRRTVIFFGLGVALASTLCFIFARGLPLLFAGRFLSGFSVGVVLAGFTTYLTELMPGREAQSQAANTSAVTELLGLGLGPLLAGLMAQYIGQPTLACFYALTLLLMIATVLARFSPETMRERKAVSLRPQLAMPKGKEAAFFSLAAAGFCMFAMVGLFTSLAPSVLAERLHNTNHAIAGTISFELFLVGAIAAAITTHVPSRTSILASLILIPLGLVLLMLGIVRPSAWFFVAGTAIEGLAIGIGFAKTLREVNQLVSEDERVRVLNAYFIVTYSAAMLPVVGMGLITQFASAIAADFTFACIIGLLAITAFTGRIVRLTPGQDCTRRSGR